MAADQIDDLLAELGIAAAGWLLGARAEFRMPSNAGAAAAGELQTALPALAAAIEAADADDAASIAALLLTGATVIAKGHLSDWRHLGPGYRRSPSRRRS